MPGSRRDPEPGTAPGTATGSERFAGSAVVVDASVALKWVLPEPGAEAAGKLYDEWAAAGAVVYVPDLFWLETANVLWRLARGPEASLSPAEALEAFDLLRRAPLRSEPTAPLASRALEIALSVDATVYDAAYLSLARLRNAHFWTADAKLAHKVAGTESAEHVRLLE